MEYLTNQRGISYTQGREFLHIRGISYKPEGYILHTREVVLTHKGNILENHRGKSYKQG
jgi:hypothetical protein